MVAEAEMCLRCTDCARRTGELPTFNIAPARIGRPALRHSGRRDCPETRVEHPQRLVTRDELLQAVWPDAYVSEGLLRGYIHELREVLGDDPAAPRFIETVAHRLSKMTFTASQGRGQSQSGLVPVRPPGACRPAPAFPGPQSVVPLPLPLSPCVSPEAAAPPAPGFHPR
ncbi:MAG: winged helix-turn-helix domain-containing protein [Deltaproteobacteria bacterium]|nr:winged helix-turn-helix domain-containing protein [Deltaproteobacteria bacterium]